MTTLYCHKRSWLSLALLLILILRPVFAAPAKSPKRSDKEDCFYSVAQSGEVKKRGVAFRQILNELFGQTLADVTNHYDSQLRQQVASAVKNDQGLIFVAKAATCHRIIFDRQLEFKEHVWAKRAAIILFTEKQLDSFALRTKLELLRNSANHNKRVDLPLYVIQLSGADRKPACELGPLSLLLFGNALSTTIKVKRSQAPGSKPKHTLSIVED